MSDDGDSFPSFPLNKYEVKARNHALLCTIGFLILLPLGALVPRYLRTLTQRYVSLYYLTYTFPFILALARWWYAHWIIQFLLSGPVIFAGWAMGYQTANELFTGPRFSDPHEVSTMLPIHCSGTDRSSQKIGLALLIMYLVQLFVGLFIHFVKIPSLFHGHRPPQNYFHAILGLAILALAAYQVSAFIEIFALFDRCVGALWPHYRMGFCNR